MKYPPRVPSLTADLHNRLILHYFGEKPPASFDARAQIRANRILDLERLHDYIAENPGASRRRLKTVQLRNIGLTYGLEILMAVGAVIRTPVNAYNGGYGYWSVIA